MSLQFRKSFRITRYFRVNIGKTGFNSVSIGGRWLTLNIGRKGVFLTGSLTGSGISYRKQLLKSKGEKLNDHQ